MENLSNPVELVKKPKLPNGRNRRLVGDEESRLLTAAGASRSTALRPLIDVALETEMRLDELVSLSWRNVHLAKGVVLLPGTNKGKTKNIPLSSVAIGHFENLSRNPDCDRVFWNWTTIDGARGLRLVGNEKVPAGANGTTALRPLIVVALETAMRLGELLSLSWKNVDLEKCVALLVDTKNGEARHVPLSSVAIEILKNLPHNPDSDRVFWNWTAIDSVKGLWRRVCDKSGIDGFNFHDLRHEATSRLFERGFNPMEVAAITGHKTLQMLRRYTHLRAEDLAKRLA